MDLTIHLSNPALVCIAAIAALYIITARIRSR